MPVLVVALLVLSAIASLAMFPARFCDFRAFYCSGRVVLVGGDPYREHPLHECEHSLPTTFLSDLPSEVTIPAPFPTYALRLFAVVARLPFDLAVVAWTVGSAAALVFSIFLVSRATSAPVLATAITLGLPAVVIPLPLGQPTLFVMLALAGCASLLRVGAPRAAAFAALGTLLDPHVALALIASLYAGIPRTRWPIIGGLAGLTALSLVMDGPARQLEYIRDVLPMHALVNVPEFSQFSTANFAFTLGVAPPISLLIGNIWYVLAVIVGIVVGLRLRSRYGIVTLAFVPLAFAVFGGTHTHLQQLDLALPALLLVAAASTGMRRIVLVGMTFVVAVPWLISAASPGQFGAVAVLGVLFARSMQARRMSYALGVGSFVMLIALCLTIVASPGSYVNYAPIASNPVAEVSWGRYVVASSLPIHLWYTLGKIPTVVAFCVVLTIFVRSAFSRGPIGTGAVV